MHFNLRTQQASAQMLTDESVGAGDSTPDRVCAHGCFHAARMYMYMFKFSHSLSMQSNR